MSKNEREKKRKLREEGREVLIYSFSKDRNRMANQIKFLENHLKKLLDRDGKMRA